MVNVTFMQFTNTFSTNVQAFTQSIWNLVSHYESWSEYQSCFGKQPLSRYKKIALCQWSSRIMTCPTLWNALSPRSTEMFLAKRSLCSLWQREDASEPSWIHELWVVARLKSSVSSRDPQFEQSPLYSRHNLEFDAFMGSDGEIGGRCCRPLNGSLRCGGKNDDCVPCWCLWGMIQAVIGGWGAEKEESVSEVYIGGCYLFHYWTK